VRGARRAHAASHPRAGHIGAQPRRTERNPMNPRMIAAIMLAAPAIAFAQGAAKGGGEAIAKVNGVAVPKSRLDFMLQQQTQRGAPDNDQTRAQVRDELVN